MLDEFGACMTEDFDVESVNLDKNHELERLRHSTVRKREVVAGKGGFLSSRGGQLMAILLLAAAVACLVNTIYWRQPPSSPSMAVELQDLQHSCIIEDNIDYQSGNLYEILDVSNAERCRAKCEGEPRCGAWTWGKGRNKPGLSDRCFLKAWGVGICKPEKTHNADVVSGLPCRRPEGVAPDRSEARVGRLPTLFCFSLMVPGGYEPRLLMMQYALRTSIFACDEWTVFSNSSLQLAPGVLTSVVRSNLTCNYDNEFATAANTPIFLTVWQKVISEAKFKNSNWTVKVDPDCVFLPQRLREPLQCHEESPKGVYLNNCKYGMHGPFEAFSRNAVITFGNGMMKCRRRFQKQCNGRCKWGEDLFIDRGMETVLNVERADALGLLIEDHCDPPADWRSCEDRKAVAFHPFKEDIEYLQCLTNGDESIDPTLAEKVLLGATLTSMTTPGMDNGTLTLVASPAERIQFMQYSPASTGLNPK